MHPLPLPPDQQNVDHGTHNNANEQHPQLSSDSESDFASAAALVSAAAASVSASIPSPLQLLLLLQSMHSDPYAYSSLVVCNHLTNGNVPNQHPQRGDENGNGAAAAAASHVNPFAFASASAPTPEPAFIYPFRHDGTMSNGTVSFPPPGDMMMHPHSPSVSFNLSESDTAMQFIDQENSRAHAHVHAHSHSQGQEFNNDLVDDHMLHKPMQLHQEYPCGDEYQYQRIIPDENEEELRPLCSGNGDGMSNDFIRTESESSLSNATIALSQSVRSNHSRSVPLMEHGEGQGESDSELDLLGRGRGCPTPLCRTQPSASTPTPHSQSRSQSEACGSQSSFITPQSNKPGRGRSRFRARIHGSSSSSVGSGSGSGSGSHDQSRPDSMLEARQSGINVKRPRADSFSDYSPSTSTSTSTASATFDSPYHQCASVDPFSPRTEKAFAGLSVSAPLASSSNADADADSTPSKRARLSEPVCIRATSVTPHSHTQTRNKARESARQARLRRSASSVQLSTQTTNESHMYKDGDADEDEDEDEMKDILKHPESHQGLGAASENEYGNGKSNGTGNGNGSEIRSPPQRIFSSSPPTSSIHQAPIAQSSALIHSPPQARPIQLKPNGAGGGAGFRATPSVLEMRLRAFRGTDGDSAIPVQRNNTSVLPTHMTKHMDMLRHRGNQPSSKVSAFSDPKSQLPHTLHSAAAAAENGSAPPLASGSAQPAHAPSTWPDLHSSPFSRSYSDRHYSTSTSLTGRHRDDLVHPTSSSSSSTPIAAAAAAAVQAASGQTSGVVQCNGKECAADEEEEEVEDEDDEESEDDGGDDEEEDNEGEAEAEGEGDNAAEDETFAASAALPVFEPSSSSSSSSPSSSASVSASASPNDSSLPCDSTTDCYSCEHRRKVFMRSGQWKIQSKHQRKGQCKGKGKGKGKEPLWLSYHSVIRKLVRDHYYYSARQAHLAQLHKSEREQSEFETGKRKDSENGKETSPNQKNENDLDPSGSSVCADAPTPSELKLPKCMVCQSSSMEPSDHAAHCPCHQYGADFLKAQSFDDFCPVCPCVGFHRSKATSMTRHIERVHEGKVYRCHLCHEVKAQAGWLPQHVGCNKCDETASYPKKYMCKQCGRRCEDDASLASHAALAAKEREALKRFNREQKKKRAKNPWLKLGKVNAPKLEFIYFACPRNIVDPTEDQKKKLNNQADITRANRANANANVNANANANANSHKPKKAKKEKTVPVKKETEATATAAAAAAAVTPKPVRRRSSTKRASPPANVGTRVTPKAKPKVKTNTDTGTHTDTSRQSNAPNPTPPPVDAIVVKSSYGSTEVVMATQVDDTHICTCHCHCHCRGC